ncbi:MAG: biotin--[acetyl-CoA-carboxylase] ligase [Candidatus Thermoplasmatota archaeon]|jgi:BirA family biotin operon repressor/biotin-[acetyl-CoA-carboxylase] ligase|nr:biotin--[acetyl-CoA-carboxylase] ligase [Candidatus Thermoplasmatota archaeon]
MPVVDGKWSSILDGLTTRTIGRHLEVFDVLPSTNRLAKELASKGCIDGTVVIAKAQTEGAGRMGRSFSSPIGGLYLSVVLRPKIAPELISPLPLVFGLSAAKAIGCTTKVNALVKWPNDVLVNGKKVCGILSLSASSKGRLDSVIAGIGMNVNSRVSDLPNELSSTATTLHDVTGHEVDMEELLRNLLYFMDLHYSMFLEGGTDALLDEWSERSSTLKRRVMIDIGTTTVEGTALGVDRTGALLVRTDDGISLVSAGDCIHLE